ncbi:glycogen debranching protein GlgX [Actinobacillus pleuropneumoniae]|uniref:Glycogen operon protein n=1 Tax=Actinobacillus pleuropneumoniae serotype 3 (strain JL03) TaxID=434271 RepID=B0BT97_ACTPJ|nr:glycogen debranching protein GlgX [Actinobacillus pleuropneumoniae]ABY68954.1 glycogen operon protein [Actinobacillus pleuropneumoniae serovar 3 str. JL03]EFM90489.1 Glycogen debranching enzyme (Glycogen operon protein GlgX) [Actinobacillus pleuropneumoniae serovar 4 str. M62]UKH22097.1 glycogen debranching enzyme GlgX [Actinobacillus pleuropneumoniae]UKH40568.1 glycogen debranching enzyme GlgX [Actinobacillus pleuropneumoniae serovar 4 str. M62]UKH43120.1 glycogen debranching enzyme GlgX [
MKVTAGSPFPLGAQAVENGTNFAIFSENATAIELCLFKQSQEQRFAMRRTGDVWHLFVENIGEGIEYGFRVAGITDKQKGALFNPQKLLLDPYAKRIVGTVSAHTADEIKYFQWDDKRDNAHLAPKSVVVTPDNFDWEDDERPHYPWRETIIYELHVKGFSRLNQQIPEPLRGTYAGLAHPASIAYLKRLGVTTIELQPVSHHIDEVHLQKMGKTNYWGYNVIGHSAVEPVLAWDQEDPITEFKYLVKTLHKHGFEVILDLVYNHTAEGGTDSLTLCQRGIDNQNYYWLNQQGEYENWAGCGNALNLSHPRVCQWAIDSLVYWVSECHVDGFRFDLATTLGRTPEFDQLSPFFEKIKQTPELEHIKLIAEPWDIGPNGYQVGRFPIQFAEWNDKYRTTMREFFLGESGNLGEFARRLAGSDDLYWQYSPAKSINYFASHDGFTLQDLVSYNKKHNEANGENNRDGENTNHSNNHGVEGETDNEFVNILRDQTACSLLATLFLSNGVPMLRAGDELGHSQKGNNNAYCQDNEIAWIDWQNANESRIEYVAKWIALRKRIALLSHQNHWWTENDVQWFSSQGKVMEIEDWHNTESKALQILLQDHWLILINAKKTTQQFFLPTGKWHICLGKNIATLIANTQSVALQFEQMGVCVLQRKLSSY